MRNKFLWTIPVLLLAFAFGTALKTHAGTGENGRGFLWGGTDYTDGSKSSVGWIATNNVDGAGVQIPGTLPSSSYGVNVPPAGGALSGYAWSENVGWISFNDGTVAPYPNDIATCPGATGARFDGRSKVTGWARILSIKTDSELKNPVTGLPASNSGGWLGCIKLADSSPAYGVTFDTNKKVFGGYGWSDELGWINFAGPALKVCRALGADVAEGAIITEKPNDSEQFVAYYDMTANCADAAAAAITNPANKVTGAVTWNQDSGNVVVTSFAGGLLKTGATTGIENVGAAYKGQTVNFKINVSCEPCVLEKPENTVCQGTTIKGTNKCGNACDGTGTKACDSNWVEVAP
ncbi:MAG: hypothetical protein WCG84_02790 [Candidatus Moraniibacteriota bacterium]